MALADQPACGRLAVAVLLLVLAGGELLAQETIYRYVNEAGVTVIDRTIPPELVSRGYEILNSDGTVREVVPRAPTAEEVAERRIELEREKAERAEQERLRVWDESLLLRYSSLEDIEAARDRELRDLEVRISILRGNVRTLKQQVERSQGDAADLERAGKKVPVAIVSNISSMQGEIVEAERSIQERMGEIDEVRAGYARDIDRFTLLLDQVELRRRYSRPAEESVQR